MCGHLAIETFFRLIKKVNPPIDILIHVHGSVWNGIKLYLVFKNSDPSWICGASGGMSPLQEDNSSTDYLLVIAIYREIKTVEHFINKKNKKPRTDHIKTWAATNMPGIYFCISSVSQNSVFPFAFADIMGRFFFFFFLKYLMMCIRKYI